jgi:UDPglucose 6-dehydrogenase
MKRTISVIGQGFVGGSLTTVFSEKGFNVIVYDKAGKAAPGANDYRPTSLSDLVKFTEAQEGFSGIYFACLPTPMFEDGSADLSIVEGVLDELSTISGERIVVIKSTIPPGSTEKWNEKYSSTGLRIIFNPEFLTERTALEDMRNQSRIILGGPRPWINSVKQIFRIAFNDVPIIKTSSTTAEMIKYLTNNFLTVKVAFANEMAQICEALDASGLNIDYDKVVEYASYDERVGKSHWNVPGPDGKRGYGGHCFPKDINAMIDVACKNGVDPKILKAAWQKNLEIRPEKVWESLTGRAVSAKSKT